MARLLWLSTDVLKSLFFNGLLGAEQEKRMTSFGWNELQDEKQVLLRNIRDNEIHGGPFHAELDITNRCNAKCFFCNQGDLITGKELPIEKIRSLIDTLADRGLRSVRLSGGGDPLVHRDIKEIFACLAEKKVVVDNLTTNGIALDKWICDEITAKGARGITISLNAVDAPSYSSMMQTSDTVFHKVTENIRYLVDRKKRLNTGIPEITIQFLLYEKNIRDLTRMFMLGRELAADIIFIRLMHKLDKNLLPRQQDRGIIIEQARKIIRNDQDEQKINLCIPGILEYQNQFEGIDRDILRMKRHAGVRTLFRNDLENYCFFGWYTTTVNGHGDVYPCCNLMQEGYPSLGNIHREPIEEIWQGRNYRRFREELEEIALYKGMMRFDPKRHEYIRQGCFNCYECDLKYVHFIKDNEFYDQFRMINRMKREKGGRVQRMVTTLRTSTSYSAFLIKSRIERDRARFRIL